MKTGKPAPASVDEYLAVQPPEIRVLLESVRATIRKAAPGAVEKISYQMPTFFQEGNLVHFAAFKKHIGLYPGSGAIESFKDELARFECSKGTIRFPLDKPIPHALIGRIVKFRVRQNLEKARAKMARK